MPGVVVELAVDGFDERLEGAGAEVDDEPDGATFQRQVHVIGRFARVEHEAVPLQGSEGQRDLVRAALNGGHGQVIAEKLISFERCHRFFFTCWGQRKKNVFSLFCTKFKVKFGVPCRFDGFLVTAIC